MAYEIEGVVHKVSVGKEMRVDAVMNFVEGHTYKKGTLTVAYIKETVEDGIFWLKIFVRKVNEDNSPLYLWKKISETMKIEYDVEKV